MKIAEAIRNVSGMIAITTFSFSMFAGFICGLLTTKENMISLAVTLVIGLIAFIMHKIANEKGE